MTIPPRGVEAEAGWIYEPIPPHVCIQPTKADLDKRVEGAIWCCGQCGAYWEVTFIAGVKQMVTISPVEVQKRRGFTLTS